MIVEIILKVFLLILLTDLMNLFCFKRKRDRGYFCVNSKRNSFIGGDAWHDTKLILMLFLIGELVNWDIWFLIIGAIFNWVVHEFILYHGFFEKFNNHKEI